MLRDASLNDWLWTCAYTLRHPLWIYRTMRLFHEKKAEEDFLRFHTQRRQTEAALRDVAGEVLERCR